jgi:hypothetical protein
MSQDLQMDMKKQAALDIDIRYVAQPILHSSKLFNVDDRVQASESLSAFLVLLFEVSKDFAFL